MSTGIKPTGNLFLDHLPPGTMRALQEFLTPVSLKSGEIVYQPDETFEKILFPTNSIISVVWDMSDGATAEVGIIGREGMTGLPIALGQSSAQQRAIVQVPNLALCMPVAIFRETLERDSDLKTHALRYAQATINAAVQLAACNSLHFINERCARWLLMAHDRVDDDVLLLTQEFLGQMLAVRRTSVNVAASALQEAGFISYSRGHIAVRNRAGLESAACECYDSLERTWQTVMGYSTKRFTLGRYSEPDPAALRDGKRAKTP